MCYTTDEYVKPKTEVTYNPQFPYGRDGYRTNCNNIPVSLPANHLEYVFQFFLITENKR